MCQTTSKTEIDLREIGRKLRVEQKCRWLADAVSQNIDGGSTEMGDGKCSDSRRKADEGLAVFGTGGGSMLMRMALERVKRKEADGCTGIDGC